MAALRQVESFQKNFGKFLRKFNRKDKVEILIKETLMTYSGYLCPCIEDGEESETNFYLETEDGQSVEFCIWELYIERSYFDNINNTLVLVVERVENIIYD